MNGTVPNRWNDEDCRDFSPQELLRYRSNLLASDLRITNYGGGNTSAKVTMQDPVGGEDVEVLWVKGSGGDLGSMGLSGFAKAHGVGPGAKGLPVVGRLRGTEPEVPLADGGRSVAAALQQRRQRQATLFDERRRVALQNAAFQPRSPSVPSGEKTVAGGRAHRRW